MRCSSIRSFSAFSRSLARRFSVVSINLQMHGLCAHVEQTISFRWSGGAPTHAPADPPAAVCVAANSVRVGADRDECRNDDETDIFGGNVLPALVGKSAFVSRTLSYPLSLVTALETVESACTPFFLMAFFSSLRVLCFSRCFSRCLSLRLDGFCAPVRACAKPVTALMACSIVLTDLSVACSAVLTVLSTACSAVLTDFSTACSAVLAAII